MLSYSPINQVQAQPYPSVLVTSGLHDPRVAYWEPAKWVQILRAKRTNEPADGKEILLKMDLSAGHFSASDRYKYLRELAFDYAWLLDELGLRAVDAPPAAGSK
jgi:oligopeptidase B